MWSPVNRENSMRLGVRSSITLRLCAVLIFVSYLFAGASFALPNGPLCKHCAQMGETSTVKPGASCPLSSRGHHCHTKHGQNEGGIVMCPDGCLHHGQGEISAVAKYMTSPPVLLLERLPLTFAAGEILIAMLENPFPPPYYPPISVF